jgi:uncharacterized membrane protein YfcA
MFFPIARAHLSPLLLIGLGFVIGIFGGFFGVGGSFLAGPSLFALGVPFNFVVGTDLAHIVGKSIVAAKLIMVVGTIMGSEMGVQAIEELKRRSNINQVVGAVTIIVLTAMSAFVAWESWATLALQKRRSNAQGGDGVKDDAMAFDRAAKAIQKVKWAPVVSLPHSGIESVSLWAILGVAFVGGIFSGFLGGGAGYIRMPSMVYLLGIPTHVAIGTDLFEIIISAGYGTVRHALHGNVDVLIALVMQTGAAVGAQIGATMTQYFTGPRIRLAFAPLPLIGALLVVYGLVSGHHH